jgi:Toprim domain
MPCPICQSDKPSLSIWPVGENGIGIKCHYSAGHTCHPIAIVYRLQAMGIDISTDDLNRGRTEVSQTWHEIWNASEPLINSHSHDYLISRGIELTNMRDLRTIRYLKHQAGGRHPCMLALVTNPVTNERVAMHRTYLNPMGTGKADLVPNKMTLGSYDKGVVQLYTPSDKGVIAVGEGIETCLSYTQLTGVPTWCSVSAGNTSKIVFPPHIHHVILLKDNDPMGELSTKAAEEFINKQKIHVTISAPDPRAKDFNDEIMGNYF